MGRTSMSTRELERARILAQVAAGTLCVREAAPLMGVSQGQAQAKAVRRLLGAALPKGSHKDESPDDGRDDYHEHLAKKHGSR